MKDWQVWIPLVLLGISVFAYGISRIAFYWQWKRAVAKEPVLDKLVVVPGFSWMLIRIFTYFCILILFLLSFYKPFYQNEEDKIEIQGVDVLFVIDVSLSMLADDLRPNRISRVKQFILELVPELQGNRLGILVFAGSPFLYCPLTSDIGTFSDFIKGLNTETVGDRGTDLDAALSKTQEILESSRIFRHRLVVFISDGEDLKGGRTADLDADFMVWGTGTPDGGPLLYENENKGSSGYLTVDGTLSPSPQNPKVIISRPDAEFLSDLASENSGELYWLGSDNLRPEILLDKINSMEKNQSEEFNQWKKSQGYRYFLVPALILLFLDVMIWEWIWKRRLRSGNSV